MNGKGTYQERINQALSLKTLASFKRDFTHLRLCGFQTLNLSLVYIRAASRTEGKWH
ncbi:hypothetical protein NSTC731_02059 [Nostoc sp. DSM 114167]